MRRLREILMLMALAASPMLATDAQAQAFNSQKDCKTVLQCNFNKNGSYRGCISAYTCRVCKFVGARCDTISASGSSSGRCYQQRCSWGG